MASNKKSKKNKAVAPKVVIGDWVSFSNPHQNSSHLRGKVIDIITDNLVYGEEDKKNFFYEAMTQPAVVIEYIHNGDTLTHKEYANYVKIVNKPTDKDISKM